MLKLRSDGGLKLIHLLTKSHASLCMWLVSLITSLDLLLNLQILKRLMGEQPSHKSGVDVLFSPQQYLKTIVKFTSPFYNEALSIFTTGGPVKNKFSAIGFLIKRGNKKSEDRDKLSQARPVSC